MNFNAALPVSELTHIIRVELAERLGAVRMEATSVRDRVEVTAVLACNVFVISRVVRDGSVGADECARPLIVMADGLARDLWNIAGDSRMRDSLAFDITLAAFQVVNEHYPLVAQREVGL